MNRFLLILGATVALLGRSLGATDTYINNGIVSMGDQSPIDATNFINNGQFYATNTANLTLTSPYYTYDTLVYSNRNIMSASFGFRFDQTPSGPGSIRMADTFANIGSVTDTNSKIVAGISIDVFATNIFNKGLLEVGRTNTIFFSSFGFSSVFSSSGSFLKLTGKNIDLTRGTLRFTDSESSIFTGAPSRMFDLYWGKSTNAPFSMSISNDTVLLAQSSSTSTNLVNGFYQFLSTGILLTNPASYVYEDQSDPENVYRTIVLVNNSNAPISVDVAFLASFGGGFATPVVQWSNVVVNPNGAGNTTNLLYLTDDFGNDTNLAVRTTFNNQYVNSSTPTYSPVNYSFSQNGFTGFGILSPSNTFISTALFGGPLPFGSFFANRGSSVSYGATLSPITFRPEDLSLGASVVNQPGRIEIRANQITMNRTRIDALNYLALTASNHFAGSSNAFVTVPYSDISLATTNGVLNVTNLLSAYVPRMVGEVYLWSGRWTNVDVNLVTNRYHVLMVDSHLNPKFPTAVNTVNLRSTNIVLSDILNVQSNLFMTVERLTLTTNVITGTGGEINIQNPSLTLETALTNLQYLTNYGRISSVNNLYFGMTNALQTFVNRGSINSEGNEIHSVLFENSANIVNRSAAFYLQSTTASLTNGVIEADNADIILQTGSLAMSGHTLQAARAVTFNVTGNLSDTLVPSYIQCHDGFNLLSAPAIGNMFNTTVTNIAFDNADVVNTWAAIDKGPAPSSFTNSSTIGNMVLVGGNGSQFTFAGASANNALYIDHLELRDYATNSGSLNINPNIKLYVASASPISPEKLSQLYPGVIWVSSFMGPNSTTNLTLRNGQTISVNSSVPGSTTLDSDGDGVPNSIDPYPFDGLQVTGATNGVLQTVAISWYADSASWQYVIESSTDLVQWSTLTTVTSGPTAGQQMTYQDSLSSGIRKFYRVRTLSH